MDDSGEANHATPIANNDDYGFQAEFIRLGSILTDPDCLTKLPAEILMMIIEDLPDETLRKLAATCLTTRAISEPILYRRHVISHDTDRSHAPPALVHGAWYNFPRTIQNCVDQMRALWKDEFNINVAGWRHADYLAPALHFAAFRGSDAAVELLLDMGAKINSSSPFVCGCTTTSYISYDFDLEAWADEQVWYPLHLALCQGHTSTAKILMARGANSLMSPATPIGAIHSASLAKHDPSIFEAILTKVRSGDENWSGYHFDNMEQLVNDAGPNGPPLHFATVGSRRNGLGPMEFLLSHGADPDAKAFLGPPPLSLAVRCGLWAAANLLLSHGANINPPDALTNPVVIDAIWSGCHIYHMRKSGFIPVALADHCTRLTHNDINQWKTSRWEFILTAIKAADVDLNTVRSIGGKTPLTWIASQAHMSPDHLHLMKRLRSAGADLTVTDRDGHTPLHELCRSFTRVAGRSRKTTNGIIDSIRWVVKSEGACCITEENHAGKTPVDIILNFCNGSADNTRIMPCIALLGDILRRTASRLDVRTIRKIGRVIENKAPVYGSESPSVG